MIFKYIKFVLVSAFSLCSATVSSETLNFSPNDPWGPEGSAVFVGFNRTQQAYSSSIFSGPINISSVSYTVFQRYAPATTVGETTWLMSLSTSKHDLSIESQTSYSNGGLSNSFNENVGADAKTFGTLVLSGTYSHNQTITFDGSFNYDPSQGDLLIDIQLIEGDRPTAPNIIGIKWGGSNLNSAMLWGNSTTGPEHTCSPMNAGLSRGCGALFTQFEFTSISPVPEPSTYAMFMFGLSAIGIGLRRHPPKSLQAS